MGLETVCDETEFNTNQFRACLIEASELTIIHNTGRNSLYCIINALRGYNARELVKLLVRHIIDGLSIFEIDRVFEISLRFAGIHTSGKHAIALKKYLKERMPTYILEALKLYINDYSVV
jgi:hypothetical protein